MFSSLIFTNGCFTSYVVKDAIGEKAEVNIRSFRSDNGDFVVNWLETPVGNESAIYVSSPLNECAQITCYLDTQDNQKQEITDKFQAIFPVENPDKQSRADKARALQLKECDVFISFGTITQDDFSGISIIIDQGIIAEKAFPMPEDKPPDSSMWLPTIFAPLADAIAIPFGWAYYVAGRGPIPDGEIVVSFDFENGVRKETSLTYDEANETLKRQFPKIFDDFYGFLTQKELTVRFWTRAALAKLNTGFREERFDSNVENLEFTTIGSEETTWGFDLRDGTPKKCSLMNYIGTTGYIRFSHYY